MGTGSSKAPQYPFQDRTHPSPFNAPLPSSPKVRLFSGMRTRGVLRVGVKKKG